MSSVLPRIAQAQASQGFLFGYLKNNSLLTLEGKMTVPAGFLVPILKPDSMYSKTPASTRSPGSEDALAELDLEEGQKSKE